MCVSGRSAAATYFDARCSSPCCFSQSGDHVCGMSWHRTFATSFTDVSVVYEFVMCSAKIGLELYYYFHTMLCFHVCDGFISVVKRGMPKTLGILCYK